MSHFTTVATLRRFRFAFAATIVISMATPLLASRPYVVDGETMQRLQRGVDPGEKLVLDRVPVVDGNPMKLELERFEVWAPNVQIIVYGKDGKSTHKLPRPETRFYKGHIAGEPDSTIAISVEPNGHIEGAIFSGDRMFSIARGRRQLDTPRGPRVNDPEPGADRDAPLMVREFDPVEDLVANPDARNWHCETDSITLNQLAKSGVTAKPQGEAVAPQGTPASGVSYKLNLAIETDGELWAAFGSDAAVTSYLGILISQASVIYQRDLATTLTLGTVHLWQNASTDPWTVATGSGTAAALAEFGTYWHNNYSAVNRSSVVFVSGKAFFGGIAWINQLCNTDTSCGAGGVNCGGSTYNGSYYGGYAFCGSTVVTTTVPDPTLTVNGVQYGLPNNNNFWMLLEVAHELGHNANGEHTHCIALSSAQQTQYNVPGRTYVDLCFGGEGGCYGGATSAPAEKGTIMSYCHNINVGGFPASRYLFGKAGEPSELVFPFFATGLNNATSGLNATITIGSNLACAAGQTASVPANGSATFAWQITGGNITSSTTSNSITFTPTLPSVTVTVTVTNTKGCAIVNSATVSTQCAAITAPTNVVATATSPTSVDVTWTAVSGATSYTVYRSANGTTYTQVGTPATNSFTNNTGLTANTAYLYKVTATGPGGTSGDSNRDLATTVIFTDPSLQQQTTIIKAAHIEELRTAVNAVHVLAGLGSITFTDPSPLSVQSMTVNRLHLIELRTNLDAARSALTLSAVSYTDSTITVQSTPIKAAHINDLRGGVM